MRYMFSFHTTAEKCENAVIKDRVGFVFMEKVGRKITDYLISSSLESSVFKVFFLYTNYYSPGLESVFVLSSVFVTD